MRLLRNCLKEVLNVFSLYFLVEVWGKYKADNINKKDGHPTHVFIPYRYPHSGCYNTHSLHRRCVSEARSRSPLQSRTQLL